MKSLLITIFTLLQLSVYSQQDSVTLPVSSVILAAERIQRLERSDSLKTLQLQVFKSKVLEMENVIGSKDYVIGLKTQEIQIYKNILSNFVDLPDTKRKWYNSSEFVYASGIVTGGLVLFTGAKLVVSLK